ncbi:MAG TPA: helix-turn-helix domain-containing protein [Candidatus Kapabacteria bacterium]|nr:helix-turn-helix domain-containing protein [Candidatus Kapabacteria bacterium]
MEKPTEILTIENLCKFEHLINRNDCACDINMLIMPGTLEDKHKNVDPVKGIPAVRRQFNLVFLFLGGEEDLYLGADYRMLKPNDLVIVPENVVAASPIIRHCKGYCIHFRTDFLKPLLSASLSEDFPYFDLEAEHVINLSDDQSGPIQQCFKDIIEEHKRFTFEKYNVLRSLVYILLLRIREIYNVHAKKSVTESSRALQLTNKFKHLAEKNFIEKRSVKEYAEMMSITPNHLSDVVKETIGKSPIQIIQDLILLEAKVLLRATDKTASEIAYELRFEDQSHFSRFIKQRTGLTPHVLRKQL